MTNTNKVIVGAVLAVGIGGFIYYSSSLSKAAPATAVTAPAPAPTGTAASTGSYKDGTYTGASASTVYGAVQVSATVAGGKLSNVTFLAYPNGDGHSSQVSAGSMPTLTSEAIAAQSANVSAVTGATQTSEGFQQSLQSALAQAQS